MIQIQSMPSPAAPPGLALVVVPDGDVVPPPGVVCATTMVLHTIRIIVSTDALKFASILTSPRSPPSGPPVNVRPRRGVPRRRAAHGWDRPGTRDIAPSCRCKGPWFRHDQERRWPR